MSIKSPSKHLLSLMKQSFKQMFVSLLKPNLTLMAVSRIKRQPEELQDLIYGLALLSGNIESLFRDQTH
jgi:hypothetical protein